VRRAHVAGLVLGFAFLVAGYQAAHAQDADDMAEDGAEGAAKEKPKETSALKVFAAYALVAAGAIVIGAGVAKTFSSSMSYPQTRLMLINFLRTNPYQAEAVSKRMKGTFCEAVASAMKIGGMTGSQDPAIVAQATVPSYDAAGKGVVMGWGTLLTKAKLALVAAIAGAAIALSDGRVLPVIIAALAVAGFVRLFLYKNAIEADVVRGRAEVLPEVDRAIASGRFVTPMPPRPGA
jgi:hypothetical protein